MISPEQIKVIFYHHFCYFLSQPLTSLWLTPLWANTSKVQCLKKLGFSLLLNYQQLFNITYTLEKKIHCANTAATHSIVHFYFHHFKSQRARVSFDSKLIFVRLVILGHSSLSELCGMSITWNFNFSSRLTITGRFYFFAHNLNFLRSPDQYNFKRRVNRIIKSIAREKVSKVEKIIKVLWNVSSTKKRKNFWIKILVKGKKKSKKFYQSLRK